MQGGIGVKYLCIVSVMVICRSCSKSIAARFEFILRTEGLLIVSARGLRVVHETVYNHHKVTTIGKG